MPNTKGKDDTDNETSEQKPKKRGWDEIESLFDTKKAKAKQERQEKKHAQNKKGEAKQKKHANRTTDKRATGLVSNCKTEDEWVDDGLGGKFNREGFTGRVEDGVKIFKQHVMQSKPNAGNTAQCPFDCDCCFI